MNTKGFTLLEMLVTLTLVALIAGFAAPYFEGTIERNKVNALTKDLSRSLAYARSAAMESSGSVWVCPVASGADCSSAGDWADGWHVTDGTHVLQTRAVSGSIGVANLNSELRFASTGYANQPSSFRFYHDRDQSETLARVSVGVTGRTQIN